MFHSYPQAKKPHLPGKTSKFSTGAKKEKKKRKGFPHTPS
jgi:hypothetical protein